MPSIQHLVSPKLPTVLADDTCVDLPGYDILLAYVDQVHIISMDLDICKFKDALSRVLQIYPHAAGQLRYTDGHWSIELTNSAVPVDVDQKHGMSSNSFLDGEWVVQRGLSPLLNEHPVGSYGFGANAGNNSAPLLRLKLTLLDHETCIGVSWNHTLGDAIVISRFMHMLSQFYQDLPPKFTGPTFEKYHFSAPSPVVVAELFSRMPLYQLRHFDEAAYIESRMDLEEVRWRFNNHELDELRSALSVDKQNKNPLSKQDCLTAYLVAVLNSSRNNPVRVVRNVSSYRHIKTPFVQENVAGNLLLIVPASVPDSMAEIASAIRDALVQSRDPHFLHTVASLKSEHMLEAVKAGKLHAFSFDDGELAVNSYTSIDWCSAHFGCPESSRFHMGGVYKDGLRCFRSNPEKGDDGVWQARQSIDISVGVPAELKPRVMDILTRGIRYMLDKYVVL